MELSLKKTNVVLRPFWLFKPGNPISSSKLTWQWKITIFNRRYIFKRSIFHCYVSLPECKNLTQGCWFGPKGSVIGIICGFGFRFVFSRKEICNLANQRGCKVARVSMILPTYPGKIPQTSPNPHKERNSLINCWWNIRGIFQGYVGGILESCSYVPVCVVLPILSCLRPSSSKRIHPWDTPFFQTQQYSSK